MKRTVVVLCLLFILMLSLTAVAVPGDEEITVYVNEAKLDSEEMPFIENERTLVPMRKIFEALDASVEWIADTQSIVATKGDTQIILQIDNDEIYKNGVVETLEVAPRLVDGTTFVPLRAVSQSLGAQVDWIGYAKSAYIDSPQQYSTEIFFGGTSIAGYRYLRDFAEAPSVDENICVKGKVVDVCMENGDVYILFESRYVNDEIIAIYLGDQSMTSIDKISELFDNRLVSVGGKYLGKTEAFNTHTMTLEHVCTDKDGFNQYTHDELTSPLLSLVDETVTMYDRYNYPREVDITKADEYYEKHSWTYEPRVALYASDGSTTEVVESEVDYWLSNGWSLNPPQTNSSYNYDSQYGNVETKTDTIYRTPTGKRYHYSRSCAGKNAISTTLGEAQSRGLTPCKTCSR